MRREAIPYIAYYLMGIFHIVTLMAGFDVWFDGRFWFLKCVLSATIAFIPIISTGVAVFAAVSAWGWTWLASLTVYICPIAIIAGLIWRQNEIEYCWRTREELKKKVKRILVNE